MAMIFNEDTDSYGADPIATQGLHVPDLQYFQTDEHEANLNIEEPEVDAMSVIPARAGYPEPEGSVTVSAHTKIVPTYMYSLLGNYRFTENGASITTSGGSTVQRNVHEFWMGENSELPQWASSLNYSDFMQKRLTGCVTDTLDWTAGLDKTELEIGFKYRNEKSRTYNLETYRQMMTINEGLPLIGYDYNPRLNILENDTLQGRCFKEVKISVENNLISGEDVRCLGNRFYSVKPTSDSKSISIECTTSFTRDKYDLIMGAAYSNTNVTEGYHSASACQTFTGHFQLSASPCAEEAEQVIFDFPQCLVNVDNLTADGNNLEATMKLTPIATGEATLLDNTKVRTPMYVKVVTAADTVV